MSVALLGPNDGKGSPQHTSKADHPDEEVTLSISHERKARSADDLHLEADCANIAPRTSLEYAKEKPKKMTQWADGGENATETPLEIVVDGGRQDLDTDESDEVKR